VRGREAMSNIMTLIERLRNPEWNNRERLFTDMTMAADRIEQLETAINRYLAGDYSCNGGAEELFEGAIAKAEKT
jgi:hypothetical protein